VKLTVPLTKIVSEDQVAGLAQDFLPKVSRDLFGRFVKGGDSAFQVYRKNSYPHGIPDDFKGTVVRKRDQIGFFETGFHDWCLF
jgi:hypothetical protein